MKSILVVCLAVIGVCCGQTCMDKVPTFMKCLAAVPHGGATPPPTPNPDDFKAKITACFQNNGCQVPDMSAPTTVAPAVEVTTAAAVSTAPNPGQACFEGIKAAGEAQFKQCMADGNINLDGLPLEGQAGQFQFGGHHAGGNAHRFMNPLKGIKKVKEMCGDSGNFNATLQCLGELFPKPNMTRPTDEQLKAEYDSACAAKKQCEVDFTDACITEMKNALKVACKCGQALLNQTKTISQGVPACADAAANKPDLTAAVQPADSTSGSGSGSGSGSSEHEGFQGKFGGAMNFREIAKKLKQLKEVNCDKIDELLQKQDKCAMGFEAAKKEMAKGFGRGGFGGKQGGGRGGNHGREGGRPAAGGFGGPGAKGEHQMGGHQMGVGVAHPSFQAQVKQ